MECSYEDTLRTTWGVLPGKEPLPAEREVSMFGANHPKKDTNIYYDFIQANLFPCERLIFSARSQKYKFQCGLPGRHILRAKYRTDTLSAWKKFSTNLFFYFFLLSAVGHSGTVVCLFSAGKCPHKSKRVKNENLKKRNKISNTDRWKILLKVSHRVFCSSQIPWISTEQKRRKCVTVQFYFFWVLKLLQHFLLLFLSMLKI